MSDYQLPPDLATLIDGMAERLSALERTPSPRIVRGTVSAAGAIVNGSGFSSVKNTTGDYTVTFTAPFGSAPIVVPGAGTTAFGAKLKSSVAPTESAFSVYTFITSTGVLNDGEFTFTAVAQ